MTTALLVIDIQNDMATDPETRIPHAERINTAGQKILSVARAVLEAQQGQAPAIVFVQHEEKPEDGPLVRDTEPWKLVFEPHAHAHRERRIPKWTRDTFESNPNLASELKAAGIGEIVAFGIQSECCVESTCSGAITAGFKVTLLSGAHSTYNSGSKAAEEIEREVEERLQAKGAMVVPWEEAVAGWERNKQLSC